MNRLLLGLIFSGFAFAQMPSIGGDGGAGGGGGSGTVTSITCNGGLTGGTITTSGTCAADKTLLAQKFFGTAPPGSVAGNLPGDLFSDTTNHNDYWCAAVSGTAAPACTSVTAGGWTLLNGGGGSPAGSTNVIQKNGGSGAFAASSATDDGTNFTVTEPVKSPSFVGTDASHSGAVLLDGLTSGGVALAVADVAGTAITYVLPSTNGTAGQVLSDSGSTTCPTLVAGLPTTCHLLQFIAGGGNSFPTFSTRQGYDDFCGNGAHSITTSVLFTSKMVYWNNNSTSTIDNTITPCGITLTTPATSGMGTNFTLYAQTFTPIPATQAFTMEVVFSVSSATDGTFIFAIGADNITRGNSNGIGIEAIPGTTNVSLVTCSGFSCTTTSSGIAYSTNTVYKATMSTDGAGNACIQVNAGSKVCTGSHVTSNSMSAVPGIQWGVVTGANSAVTATIYGWAYSIPGF